MKIMKTILMLMLTAIIVICGALMIFVVMLLTLDISNEATMLTMGTIMSLLMVALMINECEDMIWGD